jgi:uncharacterized membrane protein (UPF0182 family)
MPRRRRVIVLAVVVLVVLLLSLKGLAGFWVNELWFDARGLASVWSGVLVAKLELAFGFSAVMFLFVWASLAIVDRISPRGLPAGPDEELVRRYRSSVGRHGALTRVVAALALGLLVGTGASGEWENWLLFQHPSSFPFTDPEFHKNVGFYVFRLPFLSYLVSWGFLALFVTLLATIAAYYLNGGIRPQAPSGQRVTPQVKAHLSVLLAALAIVKALGYWLQRYKLTTSTSGYVEGAGYADVHAKLPALNLLVVISLVAAVLLVVNIRNRGWTLPVIGVGLWAFLALVVGTIYPALIEKLKVEPAQNTLELPYIARNITATRDAYGLGGIQTVDYPYAEDLSPDKLAGDLGTLESIRIWDPRYAQVTYNKLQDLLSYYQFQNLSLDRYTIDGKQVPTILALREIDSSQLPAQSWVNRHLVFTHGYGAVLGPANVSNANGEPHFDIRDIPTHSSPGAPKITQPSVYYGPGLTGFVIGGSKEAEVNYQQTNGASDYTHYRGSGGIAAGGILRRAALALDFSDLNLLISNQITPSSRVMTVRGLDARVAKAAPFLSLGSHPYSVILNGKLYWVVNAYTTTSHYPYSQAAHLSELPNGAPLRSESFNYLRNSVKVLVNAYSGSMRFYVTDPHDPIIQSWEKVFPKMFQPASSMPKGLTSLLRYPSNDFAVQAAMFGRYHITNPSAFYNASDAWQISQSAGHGSPSSAFLSTAPTDAQGFPIGPPRAAPMQPEYQLLRVPGDAHQSFNIMEAFVPISGNDQQQNLTAFMVGSSSPADFGHLEVFVMPRGELVDGPALVDAKIESVQAVSQAITLLDQHGSRVKLGRVLMVPIDNSLLYVRSLYVESSSNPLAAFTKVIVVYGNHVVLADNLSQALTDLFGSPVPGLRSDVLGVPSSTSSTTTPSTTTPSPTSTPSEIEAEVHHLSDELNTLYAQAQTDLHDGNLGGYQKAVDEIGSVIQQLQQVTNAAGVASGKVSSSKAVGGTAKTGSTTGGSAAAAAVPAGSSKGSSASGATSGSGTSSGGGSATSTGTTSSGKVTSRSDQRVAALGTGPTSRL